MPSSLVVMARRLARGPVWAIATIVVFQGALPCQNACAAVTYTLGTTFNGVSPTSTAPYLTASFNGTGGTVTLTLTASLNVASEFIDEVAFNVNPSFTPSALTIVQNPIANPIPTLISNTTQNAQNLGGGGSAGSGFDIDIKWGTAGPPTNPSRFKGTDVVSFTITGTGLTENDFNFTNTGSAAASFAAHVQGIPQAGGGTTSGAIKNGGSGGPNLVPEPSTFVMALGALVPLGMVMVRRRRLEA